MINIPQPVTHQAIFTQAKFTQDHSSGFGSATQNQTAPAVSPASLLQTIAKLARQTVAQQGWLLVIAPPCQLTKSMLEQANINSQRILLIQQRQISRFDDLMRDALTCATCSAVVSFLPEQNPQLADYRYLSAKYGTPLVNLQPCDRVLQH